MEDKYYYVPLEQISENIELVEQVIGEDEIIGFYPHKSYINGIVKDAAGYDINLIVKYDSQKEIAIEALTGREIPVYNVYENDCFNVMATAHTYIKNTIDKENNSTVFTDRTCIDTMPKREVKSKLDMYFHKYNKESLLQLLNDKFREGEIKFARALINYNAKIQEEEELDKEVEGLIRKLKNQS